MVSLIFPELWPGRTPPPGCCALVTKIGLPSEPINLHSYVIRFCSTSITSIDSLSLTIWGLKNVPSIVTSNVALGTGEWFLN